MLAEYNHIKRLAVAIGILAAVSFNNWLLGPVLNDNLFSHNGAVSEYSASSQPYHWVFRLSDILAGGLIIALAWLLSRHLKHSRYGKWIIVIAIILGIANILDAAFALPCSETLDANCAIPVDLSFPHYHVPAHAYSSVLVAICYLFLPLTGLVYAYRNNIRQFLAVSLLAVTAALVSFLSASLQYATSRSLSVRTSGFGQEVQMLILGLWIIVLSFSAYRNRALSATPKKDNPNA